MGIFVLMLNVKRIKRFDRKEHNNRQLYLEKFDTKYKSTADIERNHKQIAPNQVFFSNFKTPLFDEREAIMDENIINGAKTQQNKRHSKRPITEPFDERRLAVFFD